MTPDLLTEQRLKNYWAKVDRSGGDDACWPWLATKTKQGYGKFGLGVGFMPTAQRVAYLIDHGAYDSSLYVCHKCDNPPCVNPKHLFLGTLLDNMRDRHAKGRYVGVRGEASPSAKLSDMQATSIRGDKRKLTEIAAEYGVSISLVSQIRLGHVRKAA